MGRSISKPSQSIVVFGLLAIYFGSGFAALLYQVVWQRMLAFFSGADLYATTTIVASFMAGLGFGSLCAGWLADRLSLRGQIYAFAFAEFLCGTLGLISKWWYYDVLYTRFGHIANSSLTLAAILFTSLLLPTFLMGMTFPLLAKALTPAVELAGKRIGSLYAVNTLGAAFGALTTAWVLLGVFDLPHILQMAAGIDFAIGVAAIAICAGSKGLFQLSADAHDPALVQTTRSPSGFGFSTWILIYALSGFLALSLEIVWFRLLGVMLKSSSRTFPHLLGIYLSSFAVGIFFGTRLVARVRRAAEVFLALQGAITISAVSAIVALGWGLNHFQFLGWLRGYLAAYDPFDVTSGWQGITTWKALFGPWPNFLSLYLVVPLVFMAAPTVMMGISFPFLQSAVQDDSSLLGRRVGWLQASNIFGATIGTILVGGFLLDVMGTSWTLRLIVALGAVFLFLSVKQIFESDTNRKIGYVFAALLAAAPIGGVQSGTKLWAKLHGATAENIIVAEDGTGLAVLKNSKDDFSDTTWVFTNGLGQSWIPYHQFNVIHSRLGVLPALMHPAPREIAVIGLGSGDTLFGLGGREETQEITCIEIVAPQLKVLTDLGLKRPYGGVDSLLNDRRIRFVFADGRRHLRANSKKYDIVEADALRPNSAFAGNLYSVEYFELLKSRLKPGGLALTWAPTARTVNTFAKVFPHSVNFGAVLVGSDQPIEYDPDVIKQRLEHPFTKGYYARAGLNLDAIMGPLLVAKPEALRMDLQQIRSSSTNTDLSPKDEYGR